MSEILNFDDTAPAADSGYTLVKWKKNTTPDGVDATTGYSYFDLSGEVPNAGTAVVKTANYTATRGDMGMLLVFNSSSAVTLTLPNPVPLNALATPATETRWKIAVQNIGAGTLTIARNGLLIDTAAANLTLAQNSGVEIYTDGTNYFTERGATPASVSPLTTKGDLFGHSTVDARVPVGTNGQSLVADSTQTLGVRYADRVRSIGITIFGSDLTSAGLKDYMQVNFAGTIVGAAVEADVSGSAGVEVWKKLGSAPPTAPSIPTSSDKISGSTPLAISTAQTAAYDAAALSGWSTLTIAKWDSIGFKLTGAATTSTKVKFVLYISETT